MAEKEIKPWRDRHDEIKILKVYDKSFGWMHLVVGKNKEVGNFVLRLKKFGNRFNISSKRQLAYIKKLLEEGAKEVSWFEELNDKEINDLIKKNEDFKKIKEKSKRQIEHQKETIDELLKLAAKLREQKFEISLKEFKNDLSQLKILLKSNSKEKELQNWLYEHPWVFGPTYIDNSKEEINRIGDRIDFLMQRYDTFYDVFELKLPSCPIFVGDKDETDIQQQLSRKFNISGDLKDAISQIIGYLEQFEADKKNMYYEKHIDIHKPRGIIVIGRKEEDETRTVKTLNSYFNNINIYTYDNILDMAQNFIALIENRQKKSKNGTTKK
jgi:hypothetical protein